MTDQYYRYAGFLENAGQKLKERVLDRAAQDKALPLDELVALCRVAYPEEV